MPSRFQSPPSLVAPTILAVLGVAYCLFVYLGIGESVCITAGCSIYKSFSIAGVSMWVFGIVAFVALTLLMAAGAYSLSLLFAWFCIAADCVLLLIMAATSPCLSCLGVALLFAFTYLLLRHAKYDDRRGCSGLLFLWSLLFVSNLVLAAREMLPPEPIYGSSQAPVHIYFSPTCENCLDAIDKFSFGDGQVAYYATSRSDTDVSMLIALRERLKNGEKMPDALKAVKEDTGALPPFVYSKENLLLQWHLLRNKATVLERSGGTVPYITINGVPAGGGLEIIQGDDLKVGVPAEDGLSDALPNSGGGEKTVNSEPAQTNGQANGQMEGQSGTQPGGGNASLEGASSEPMFENSTTFATCSDENLENCD